jgi:colicin import membrane protein
VRQQRPGSKGTFKALIFALIVHIIALFIAIGIGWFPDSEPYGETIIQARVVDQLPPTKQEPKQKKQVQKKDEKKEPVKKKKPPKKALSLKKSKKTKKTESKKPSKAEQEDLQRRIQEDEKQRAAAALQGQLNKAKNEFVPLIKQKVQNNWIKPEGWGKGVKCVVKVRMVPSGEVVSATVTRSCGNSLYDRSVVNAVHKASPLPVPKDSTLFEPFRSIEFTFELKE